MDAARARNFSCYGHERETSPHTDSLAADGRCFERAVPPAPATFDSVTSVLSGTYPSEHQSGRIMQINTSQPMLPAVLSERGYTTGFATSSPGTTPAFGYGEGVDEFYDVTNKYDGMNVAKFFEETRDLPQWKRYLRFLQEAADRNFPAHLRNALRFRFGYGAEDDGAKEVTAAAKEFISSAPEPWFLYVHYTETHLSTRDDGPYGLPDDELFRFTGQDADYDDLLSADGYADYDDEQVDRHERFYDAAIHYLDRQVGELVDHMRAEDAFENTLSIVTSDHGEALGEQGYVGHGTLHEPVLEIPLVVHGPGVESGRVSDRVNLLGLYATITDLAGDVPEHARCPSLLTSEHPEFVLCQNFTETWDWSEYGTTEDDGKHAFYRDALKLVSTPDGDSLYDVDVDPAETDDRSESQQDDFETLKRELETLLDSLTEASAPGEAQIDDQTRDRLKELGYID